MKGIRKYKYIDTLYIKMFAVPENNQFFLRINVASIAEYYNI